MSSYAVSLFKPVVYEEMSRERAGISFGRSKTVDFSAPTFSDTLADLSIIY